MKEATPSTVFILVDAGRWDYINPVDTPTLSRMAREGFYGQKVETVTGFTQRTTLLSGTYPDVSGNFTMFAHQPGESPYRFFRPWQPLLRWIEQSTAKGMELYEQHGGRPWNVADFVGRRVRKCIREYGYQRSQQFAEHMPPANIPLHLLAEFGASEDQAPIYEPGGLPVESIFDLLAEQQRSWKYLMFPVVDLADQQALEATIDAFNQEDPHSLYLLQFSESDAEMHKHGPESTRRRQVMGEIDRKIRRLRKVAEEMIGEVNWVVVGDHGMTEVRETIDVLKIAHKAEKKAGVKHGRDYLLFLDSTMARAWGKTKAGEQFIEELFQEKAFREAGQVVDQQLARKRHLPATSEAYGHQIWIANLGTLIHPDYFYERGDRVRGMHGYLSSHLDMHGFCVMEGPDIPARTREKIRLVDVCPTMCSFMNLPRPEDAVGDTLFEMREGT